MKYSINDMQLKKTILGMALGFIITQVLINLFFTSYNGVNPQNLGFLQRHLRSLVVSVQDAFKRSPDKRTGKERLQIITEAKNAPLQSVAPGIYYARDTRGEAVYTQFNTSQILWQTGEVILADGKKIAVRYPVGQSPPTADIFQN